MARAGAPPPGREASAPVCRRRGSAARPAPTGPGGPEREAARGQVSWIRPPRTDPLPGIGPPPPGIAPDAGTTICDACSR